MRPRLVAALSLLLLPAAASPASAFWSSFAASASLTPLPPHTPNFTVALASLAMVGAEGPYDLPVHIVRDAAAGGVVVAAWTERTSFLVQTAGAGLGELNLFAPTPALAPLALPPLQRYGWAWLWGAKVTTVTWLDCCGVTGDTSGFALAASPDGATVTLSQWQAWVPSGAHAGRDARSTHNFTLLWDPIFGYSVDATLSLRINAAAAPRAVEFLNMLTPRLAQPWPMAQQTGGWGVPPSGAPLPASAGAWPLAQPSVTAWANDSAGSAWTGFAENILAGAELGQWPLPPLAGATLTLGAGLYSPGLSYGATPGQNLSFLQSICPTWMDMHQVVALPAPGRDGFVEAEPTFSLRFAPPPASDFALARVALEHRPGSSGSARWLNSSMLRIGAVETFEDQPIPLTSSLRALAQVKYLPDYSILHGPGVGRNGSSAAWFIPAASPAAVGSPTYNSNSVPLLPLNASTRYTFSAWVQLNGSTVDAFLWAGVWEADDFNYRIAPGPTYGRLVCFNSSSARGRGGGVWVSPSVRGVPPSLHRQGSSARASAGAWVLLEIAFQTSAWPAYADLRPIVPGPAGESVLVDDWLMRQDGPAL